MSGGALNGSQEGATEAGFASRHRLATAIEEIAKLDTLGGLSLSELLFLHDALTTMEDVSAALLGAPKFFNSENDRSRAGKLVGEFYDLIANYRDAVIDEAWRRKPSDVPEAECRAEMLIIREVRESSAIESIAGVATGSAKLIARLRGERAQ